MKARKRDLVGRRIVDVNFNRFRTGTSGNRLDGTDPVITLDNGRQLVFLAQETEVGDYGVLILLREP